VPDHEVSQPEVVWQKILILQGKIASLRTPQLNFLASLFLPVGPLIFKYKKTDKISTNFDNILLFF
jgi:hypothetical protein